MNIKQWPNKLGWSVGDCADVVRGEKPGEVFVNLYRRGTTNPAFHSEKHSLLFGDGITISDADLEDLVRDTRRNAR